MSKLNHIWAEKYRPTVIDQCILPPQAEEQFRKMVEEKVVPNLLLAGDPGIGKTTAALALMNELDSDYIKINASLENGVDTLRYKVQQFASTVSLTGNRKFVIFDEADKMSNAMQDGLRAFIEEFSGNCGFIFTCNHPNKLEPAIRSRLTVVDFHFAKISKLAKAAFQMITRILDNESIQYSQEDVQRALVDYLQKSTDLRQLVVRVQKWSQGGTFTPNLNEGSSPRLDSLIDAIRTKKFVNIRKWAGENSDIPVQQVYDFLYTSSTAICSSPAAEPLLAIYVAKYAYQNAFAINAEINLVACLTEIMADCV